MLMMRECIVSGESGKRWKACVRLENEIGAPPCPEAAEKR